MSDEETDEETEAKTASGMRTRTQGARSQPRSDAVEGSPRALAGDAASPEARTEPHTEARLRRLAIVCAGPADEADEGDDFEFAGSVRPLGAEGRRQIEALTHHWEWVEAVISSPDRRARESAAILARPHPVKLDADLDPRGRRTERESTGPDGARDEDRASDRADSDRADSDRADAGESRGDWESGLQSRVRSFLERALRGPHESLLIVSHRPVIRAITAELSTKLPPGRPLPAEMVLLTRRADGRWHPGRQTSDPPPLESRLEREGLSGEPDDRAPDRRQGRIEFAASIDQRAPGSARNTFGDRAT